MVSSITSKQDVGGDAYPNYIDDRLDDPLSAYYGENAERLSSLKTEVDPNNVFRSNAIILPASDSSSSSSSSQ